MQSTKLGTHLFPYECPPFYPIELWRAEAPLLKHLETIKRGVCKINEEMKKGTKSHAFDLHERSFSFPFGDNKKLKGEKSLYTDKCNIKMKKIDKTEVKSMGGGSSG